MNTPQQAKAAREFALYWQGKGYEKGESQVFWTTLLSEVFGIEHPAEYITFEQQVRLDHTSFIDGYIRRTHVMIEQKSITKDLGAPIRQSDGSLLNPFQQAKRYAAELPYSERPRWIVTCNFREFWVYDMEQPNGEPQKILLENLEKEYYRLQFLVDEGNEHLRREMEVSVKAGELVGIIYDKLLEQYWSAGGSPADDMHASRVRSDILRSLNILCVRLVFCLYAEDAGLFATKTAFHDYLAPYPPQKIRRALIDLFEVLDTPLHLRDPYLDDDLKVFPYVNGGLFTSRAITCYGSTCDHDIIIPQFTDDLKNLLLEKASADFDWSEISPTIFGAVFESTLNPETRRSGGMHYTSIENIHKVIDPLFLNDLKEEFYKIMHTSRVRSDKRQALQAFQDKLASLTFFDPACGSGNFLTETFLSLRRLENEVIKAMYGDTRQLGFEGTIKVNISQFYGIEINDFACTVAKTALWIAESQMLQETSAIVGVDLNFLPLKTNAYIHEGNALRMDWAGLFEQPILADTFHFPDYIIGNPPFVGYSLQTKEQKEDILNIYRDEKGKPYKTAGKIDYVAGWYWKAAELMQQCRGGSCTRSESSGTLTSNAPTKNIRAALVSTNSITQGEQVAAIWQPLFERFGINIDFAYRTFRWDSEAEQKAHVHCVIIGFSIAAGTNPPSKTIYLGDNQTIQATNINPYLIDGDMIWINSRTKPLCDIPQMISGNRPTDGGYLLLNEEEKDDLIKKNPLATKYIKQFMMGYEFINGIKRYCLWLVGVTPAELRQMPLVYERVAACKEARLNSPDEGRRRLADTPTLMREQLNPSNFIALPKVSSENRRYIPMGYLDDSVIAGDKLFMIPNATLYHFGILTSNVHMAWMRVVCGRLKSDYSYSINIVYNNFPWCNPTEEQRKHIEQTAQAILDARALFPDSSLADLYDETAMPRELRKAHQENDRAVMAAYGFCLKMTESECVAELFKMYQQLTTGGN